MVQVVTNIIASFISFLTEVEQQNNVVKKFKGQFEKTGQDREMMITTTTQLQLETIK